MNLNTATMPLQACSASELTESLEGTIVGLYSTLGVPRPIAVVVVLWSYRLLSFWLPPLAGVALATYFERFTTMRAKLRIKAWHSR
jgi:hypothetical protein